MYKIEDRGNITRYYNVEKRNAVEKLKGEEWKRYRQLFDRSFAECVAETTPPHLLDIDIEITSWCNYSCIMCGRSFIEQKTREYMPLEMVKKIADEAKKMGVYSFVIGTGCESMVHPQIVEVLKTLFSANAIDYRLLSNGFLLNDDILQVIVDNQIGHLNISLDAATPETYKIVRRGGILERVEKNIQRFLDLRGDNLLPLLRVSMVKLKENKNEREAFLKKWENRADIIDLQTCVDFVDVNDINNVKKYNPDCTQPFKRITIFHDGTICPCCSGYGIHYPLGNIKDITLEEAWNGEKMNKLRELIKNNNMPNFCRKCREIHDEQ